MDFKSYPNYKDSGVEWLGEVPEHWKILQTRHLFSFGKGLTITKENLSDEGIPCINYGEIHSKYGFEFNPSDNPLKCVSHDFIESNKNCLLNEGDFIFADTSEDLDGSGNFSYLNQESIVFAGYHSIIARLKNQKNNARFFAYLFDSQAYRNQVRTEMKGVKVFSVSQGVLKSRFAWLPPNEEQVKIISFLDSETSRIDNLIAKQEKLIEKLEEHRKSVISHAVTKGLDPNVPMKDSGVEWLGEVPEHWIIGRLKNLVQIKNGSDYKHIEAEKSDSSYPVYGSGGVFTYASDFMYDKESILLGRKGTIDKPLYVTEPFWAVDTMFYTKIKKNAVGKFVYYQALGFPFGKYSSNTALPSMTQTDLLNLAITIPSVEEQNEIIQFIIEKCLQIDELINKQKELIAKLKEYRTSIISHAVTGKIDVRGFC